jgi:hypothetical protein
VGEEEGLVAGAGEAVEGSAGVVVAAGGGASAAVVMLPGVVMTPLPPSRPPPEDVLLEGMVVVFVGVAGVLCRGGRGRVGSGVGGEATGVHGV